MTEQLFLPESMYEIDSKMNHQKLAEAFQKQTSITGRITRLNSKDDFFEVNLGGGFIGIMPFESSTIYQIYKEDEKLSYGFITLVGKTIQARIIKLDDTNIVLSRKEIMLEALESLKQIKQIKFATITSFSQTSAFLDIGAGIIGKASTCNYANTIFQKPEDIGFKKGDTIEANIIGFREDLNSFDLSVVDAFQELNERINEKDIVTCKVFGSVGDHLGYYVLVDNKYAGIVDSPLCKLRYSDEIIACVSKITPNGLRLKFVEKL